MTTRMCRAHVRMLTLSKGRQVILEILDTAGTEQFSKLSSHPGTMTRFLVLTVS